MSLNIQDWYYNLPYRDFQKMRQTIATECLVTQKIVWNWMNGVTRIPRELEPVLTKIVRKYSGIADDVELNIEFSKKKKHGKTLSRYQQPTGITLP